MARFSRGIVGSNEKRSAMSFNIDFKGMPELIKHIQKLDDDVTKRRRLLSLFRKQAKPYFRAVSSTGAIRDSKRDQNHSQLKDGYTGPGNLRRSMKIFSNKKNARGYVSVHVGPRAKKKQGSGFYGYMLLPDVNAKNINKGERDWKDAAWRYSKRAIEGGVSKELGKYVARYAKRNGFEVKNLP